MYPLYFQLFGVKVNKLHRIRSRHGSFPPDQSGSEPHPARCATTSSLGSDTVQRTMPCGWPRWGRQPLGGLDNHPGRAHRRHDLPINVERAELGDDGPLERRHDRCAGHTDQSGCFERLFASLFRGTWHGHCVFITRSGSAGFATCRTRRPRSPGGRNSWRLGISHIRYPPPICWCVRCMSWGAPGAIGLHIPSRPVFSDEKSIPWLVRRLAPSSTG